MEAMELVVLGFIVILAAGFIQGLTSFGFALISMPLLTKLIPITEAVPVVVALSLITNLIVLKTTWRHIQLKKISLMIVSSLIAVPAGVWLLESVHPDKLKLFAGLLVVAFGILLLLGKAYPVQNEKIAFIPVGLTSGLLNGSISMSGPPVALFLSNQGADKQTFRANITVYGVVLNIITITTYSFSGLLTAEVIRYTVWFVPGMLVGVIVGVAAIKKLNDQTFRKLALYLIVLSGIWTVLSALKLV